VVHHVLLLEVPQLVHFLHLFLEDTAAVVVVTAGLLEV
jgi:hypothetical protein